MNNNLVNRIRFYIFIQPQRRSRSLAFLAGYGRGRGGRGRGQCLHDHKYVPECALSQVTYSMFLCSFSRTFIKKNNQPWVAVLMKRTDSVCESKHQTHYAVHKFTWFVDWPWAACSQITKFCLRAGFIRGTGLHNSGIPSWAFET